MPDPTDAVTLTVSTTGEFNDCISAVRIDSGYEHKEVIAPPEEVPYFIKDCGSTWEPVSFHQNISFVACMTLDDWESWVLMYNLEHLAA
jgi:hypothetical protein